jgi:hypothetical protein
MTALRCVRSISLSGSQSAALKDQGTTPPPLGMQLPVRIRGISDATRLRNSRGVSRGTIGIYRIIRTLRVSGIYRIIGISRMFRVAGIFRIARMFRVARIFRIARMFRIARISRIARMFQIVRMFWIVRKSQIVGRFRIAEMLGITRIR